MDPTTSCSGSAIDLHLLNILACPYVVEDVSNLAPHDLTRQTSKFGGSQAQKGSGSVALDIPSHFSYCDPSTFSTVDRSNQSTYVASHFSQRTFVPGSPNHLSSFHYLSNRENSHISDSYIGCVARNQPLIATFDSHSGHTTDLSQVSSLSVGLVGPSVQERNLNGFGVNAFPSNSISFGDHTSLMVSVSTLLPGPQPGTTTHGSTKEINLAPTPAAPSLLQSGYRPMMIPRTWVSHRSTRPSPLWVPDCRISLQEEFQPPGMMCASTYDCKWIGCGKAIDRNMFYSGESYIRFVYAHISDHAKEMSESTMHGGCGWEGCILKCRLPPGARLTRSRDKVRHIVTHLPWYTFCTRCTKITARRDARGRANNHSCVSKECQSHSDIATGIQVANEEMCRYGVDMTVFRFCEIVFGRET